MYLNWCLIIISILIRILFWKMCFCDISVLYSKHKRECRFADLPLFVWFVRLARLGAGRDQAHHLTRRTQDGRLGRGQHSHRVERRARGLGVPTQERTDPQVGCLPHCCGNKTNTCTNGLLHFTVKGEKQIPDCCSLLCVLPLTPGNIVFL